MNGSRISSFSYVYSFINLSTSSVGNGAGCPIFFALAGGIFQIERVESINSSFSIVDLPLLFLLIDSLEKTNKYSWTSLITGLEAESQLPHAKFAFAPFDFCQIISPLIMKPRFVKRFVYLSENGIYGFLPRFATLTTSLPPDSVTLYTSLKQFSTIAQYSSSLISTSLSFPIL